MGMSKSMAARAAAILTTGEVAASRIDLDKCAEAELSVQLDFTLGSLTNVVLRFYVSADGTNWYEYRGPGGSGIAQTLTASSTIDVPVIAKGWKFFRASVQGTGTVTSSSAALRYRYRRRGAG